MIDTNNEKSSSNIDLVWFNKENIDLVDDRIEQEITNLLDIEEYLELNRKLSKLDLELINSLNLEQKELLRSYQKIELEISSYQNGLAYYLGLKENSNFQNK